MKIFHSFGLYTCLLVSQMAVGQVQAIHKVENNTRSTNPHLDSYFDSRLAPFYHGVASGDPLKDRVIIWTRVTPPDSSTTNIPVEWQMATDVNMSNIVKRGVTTTDNTVDFTVKIDVTDLAPNTYYYYRFKAFGKVSVTGRTKTAPVVASRLRFAVTSCINYQAGYFNGLSNVADRNDLDAVLQLGDYIYEYEDGGYGYADSVGRGHLPLNETTKLADYRIRHSYYKLDPDLRRAHQQYPWIAVWDDHETADNSYKDGAVNHQPATEGDWQQRKAAGTQAFFEWMPIRKPDQNNDIKIFRTIHYGNLMDLIMLDTRLYDRDKQPSGPTDSTYNQDNHYMIGPEQFAWFESQLSQSTAKWKIIGQQVMMTQLNVVPALSAFPGYAINMDQWDGYPKERKRVFDFIESNHINNVVVLTGDIHSSWASDLTQDPLNPTVYIPLTGSGSLGVEFVTPSITSGSLSEALSLPAGSPVSLALSSAIKVANPQMKYVETDSHGYVILDVDTARVQADWYYVKTVTAKNKEEHFASAWLTKNNSNHLTQSTTATASRPDTAPVTPYLPDGVASVGPQGMNPVVFSTYPNPFTSHLIINYAVPHTGKVTIKLYNMNGQEIETLQQEELTPGNYTLTVQTSHLQAGIYFYQLQAGTYRYVQKVVCNK